MGRIDKKFSDLWSLPASTFFRLFKKNYRIILYQNEKNSISVANLSMRTTSSVESFNAVLYRSIERHPDFYKLVIALQIHESRKTDQMHYLATNNPSPDAHFKKKRKLDQERDLKITALTEKLNGGTVSVEEFMLAMANGEDGRPPTSPQLIE